MAAGGLVSQTPALTLKPGMSKALWFGDLLKLSGHWSRVSLVIRIITYDWQRMLGTRVLFLLAHMKPRS